MNITYKELMALVRGAGGDETAPDEPVYIVFESDVPTSIEETVCCQSIERPRVHIDLNSESMVTGIELF